VSAKERVGKLEALLARIQANASAPRGATMTAIPTVPPSAEAREALRSESSEFEAATEQEHAVVPEPEESRARLVAAGPTVEVEFEEEEVLELDERNVVSAVEVTEMAVAAAPAKEEEAPPSSRRPIAEPAESPQEAELPIATAAPLTPPPESGKQVASESLSFDDDFTGVRESAARLQSAPPPEPSIALESLREPTPPPPPDELEAELAPPPPIFSREPEPEVEVVRGDETRPPPAPFVLPRTEKPAAPKPEVTRPTTPVAASDVATLAGSVPTFEPKNFGDLLDATLSL